MSMFNFSCLCFVSVRTKSYESSKAQHRGWTDYLRITVYLGPRLYKEAQGAPSHQSPLEPTMGLTTTVVCLAAATFVVVDSSVQTGLACAGQERVTTTEMWECNRDGTVDCSKVVEDCASDTEVGGRETYLPNGLSTAVGGGGWDCRHKCRRNRGQSGSQSRTSFGSGGGGSSSGGSFGGGSIGGASFGGGSSSGGSRRRGSG